MMSYALEDLDIEGAAFALFAKQAEDWDITRVGAEYEWERDPHLRRFWIGQVLTVVEHIDGRHKVDLSGNGCLPDSLQTDDTEGSSSS